MREVDPNKRLAEDVLATVPVWVGLTVITVGLTVRLLPLRRRWLIPTAALVGAAGLVHAAHEYRYARWLQRGASSGLQSSAGIASDRPMAS